MTMLRKDIPLPRGGTLEVDLSPQFLDVVAQHFQLSDVSLIDNDHVRMYIWGAFKNAIDKAERGEYVEERHS